MTVYHDPQRGKWRYDFWLNSIRRTGYCVDPETGADATGKREATAIEAAIRRRLKAGGDVPRVPAAFTVGQLFAALTPMLSRGRHGDNQKLILAELLEFFGPAEPAESITDARVWDYIAWSRAQKIRIWIGGPRKRGARSLKPLWKDSDRTRQDATINRYLDQLRKALELARARKVLPDAPKVPELAEPTRLPNPIGDEAIAAGLEGAPLHLIDMALLCRHMGFRKREVLGLSPQQFDEQNRGVRLYAADTKANRDEFIPANQAAVEILSRRKKEALERGIPFLIWREVWCKGDPKKGTVDRVEWRPVKDVKRSWATAMKRAGVKHRQHDLKAAFTTSLAHVAPSRVVQELSRHKDPKTTEAYIRIADRAAREAVDAISYKSEIKAVGDGSPTPKSHTASRGPRLKIVK